MQPELVLPPASIRVVDKIRHAGTSVYAVGGTVRDLLLGRPLRDLDLLVNASRSEIARLFSDAVLIGERPPIVLIPERESRPRVEITSTQDTGELTENLQHRDFTLNALAYDFDAGVIVDQVGGLADLKSRTLRAVNPELGFVADPLRILRGVRLIHELELTMDANTRLAMCRESWRIRGSAGERQRDELFRILRFENCTGMLKTLQEVGAIAALLPELLRTVGISQNRHHIEDVFQHTLRVCNGLRGEPILRLAALLHDVAKPDTKLRNTGKDFSFLRHDLYAAKWIGKASQRLRLSKVESDRVHRLVRHHLLYPERLETDRAIRRMLHRVGPDLVDDLFELRRADYASRTVDRNVPESWRAAEARVRAVQSAAGVNGLRLAVTGQNLINRLGLEAGPIIGRYLQRATRHVLEDPSQNETEKLLIWLQQLQRDEEI